MNLNTLKNKLLKYYLNYDYDTFKKNSYEIENLWIELCDYYPNNSFYALYYALFLVGIVEIQDYPKAERILKPFSDDIACIIVRCWSCYWHYGDDKVLNEYDFNHLCSLPMSRQERSMLYYLKSISGVSEKVFFLEKALENYCYNFCALKYSLEIGLEKKEMAERLYDIEKFVSKTNKMNLCRKILFYKPYLYHELGILGYDWENLFDRRKYMGLLSDNSIPPLDFRNVYHDQYFMNWIQNHQEYVGKQIII